MEGSSAEKGSEEVELDGPSKEEIEQLRKKREDFIKKLKKLRERRRAAVEAIARGRNDELEEGVDPLSAFLKASKEAVHEHVESSSKLERVKQAIEMATKEGDAAPWGRAKLMVVGQGRAGKTSTIKRLLGKGFDKEENSTRGIDAQSELFSVDLRHTVGGFNEVAQDEDFVMRQVRKIAFLRYQNDGKAKYVRRRARNKLSTRTSASRKSSTRTWTGKEGAINALNNAARTSKTRGGSKRRDRRFSVGLVLGLVEGGKEEEEKQEVELTIWDYGGQKVFYALHHLFLTESGVYLLVFDMREVLNNKAVAVEYLLFWLNSIKVHAEKAPIVLVGTYGDQVKDENDLRRIDMTLRDDVKILIDFIDQVVLNKAEQLSFFPVDNGHDKGLAAVQNAVLEALGEEELTALMELPVPLSWIRCLDALLQETATAEYLSLGKVKDIARKNGVDKNDVRHMLALFHAVGAIFYFDSRPELRNVVILTPQWLIDVLTCVIFDEKFHERNVYNLPKRLITAEEVFRRTGIITDKLLAHRWSAKKLGNDIQQFLCSLMYDMLLLCDWPYAKEKSTTYLIPSVLLGTKHLKSSEDIETVARVKSYKGPRCSIDFSESFLPEGLFQRLVCLCARFCKGLKESETPTVRGHAATMSFGVEVDFGMLCEPKKNRVLVCVHNQNESQTSAAKLVKLLNSMLEQLNQEFMGARLKWCLKLNCLDKPEQFATYEALKAARKENRKDFRSERTQGDTVKTSWFDHWFVGEEHLGGLRENETKDYERFTSDVVRDGVPSAGRIIIPAVMKSLPFNMKNHCFLSYRKEYGSEIAMVLFYELTRSGYTVWFDQQREHDRSNAKGIEQAAVFILVLTKDVFRTESVVREIRHAQKLKKPLIMMYEKDQDMAGYCKFSGYAASVGKEFVDYCKLSEALPYQRRLHVREEMFRVVDQKLKLLLT